MQRDYREKELFHAVPLTPNHDRVGTIKLQVVSDLGRTKWLSITPDEFRQIEAILTNKQTTTTE